MKTLKFVGLICLVFILGLSACTEDDSFSAAKGNLLSFEKDTVKMDTVFSSVPTSLKKVWVFNRSSDGIRCKQIRLLGGEESGFRVNVDGTYLSPESGFQAQNIEIRKKDSLCVFVELTSKPNHKSGIQRLSDQIVFSLESGEEQRISLDAWTWDAKMLRNVRISRDSVLSSPDVPLVVYGGIRVDSLARLTIGAGTTLYFHGEAGIDVYGSLEILGEKDKEVTLRSDRLDHMFDYLPYDNMSGLWQGIRLRSSSFDNHLRYTDLHSAFNGIMADSSDVGREKLFIESSTIHNCQGWGLLSIGGRIRAHNSQFTNTLQDCVMQAGGSLELLHCTLAQYYPFDSKRGAALRFTNGFEGEDIPLLKMDCINSILTGYADDVVFGEKGSQDVPFNYRFASSLLRSDKSGFDEANLENVLFEDIENKDTGSLHNFRLVDGDKQRYDFHLDSLSQAIGLADTAHSLPLDRSGIKRDGQPDAGCFEFVGEGE